MIEFFILFYFGIFWCLIWWKILNNFFIFKLKIYNPKFTGLNKKSFSILFSLIRSVPLCSQLGMAMGWSGDEDLHGFVLTHPCPLGPHEALPHPVKLYFLLIFPTTSTIFLTKPISLIKIYLKLQLNLSHQIKSIFRKNWIIYSSV